MCRSIPTVRYGMLANGLKYAILKNGTPQGTASIRMRFGVGSLGETDRERGLAHFIEHMAFNGSTNVPEGEMIKLLERKGLAFGADTNASTGFEATTYKLDLPRTDGDLISTGLMLMRETAGNLNLSQAAIDRERGVVLSEMRTRDSFQLRQITALFGFQAPGSMLSQRLPIGTAEVLRTATADDLRALYQRYYRPENAVLTVVGDFDPAVVEAEIAQRFADWKPVGAAGKPLDFGTVDPKRATAADVFVDPAVPNSISIIRAGAYNSRPTTMAELRRLVLERLATGIVSRRISRIAQEPDSPIVGGGASIDNLFQTADQATVTLVAREGQWQDALKIGAEEVNRARQYGFTKAELAEQLANLERGFRQAAEQQGTRKNAALAEAIAETVAEQDLFVRPETMLAAFEKIAPTITTDDVKQAFDRGFAANNPLVFVTAKQPIEGGPAKVLEVYRAAERLAVAAPAENAVAAFGYTDFGTPGKIVSDTIVPDLDVRTIRFANNVMLNLKPTKFEDGRLRFSVELGRGTLALPADKPGMALYLSSMLGQGGLGKHSSDDLQSILAGRSVTMGMAAQTDAFSIAGSTKMADFAQQMAVSAALVTDPGYRPEMAARWKAIVPLFSAQLTSTPQQVAAAQLERILTSGDTRFGIPDQATLESRTTDELRAALAPTLARAPIEIAVVGDFDPATVIAEVARTFGALPEREAALASTRTFPGVRFPASTAPITLYHEGKPDQGLAIASWPTTDDSDAREATIVSLLAKVMQIEATDELREALGATYSPGVGSSMSDVFAGYGHLDVQVIVAPEDRKKVFDAIDGIAKSLRDAPPSADLIERARNPLLEQIANSEKDNGYWMQVAGNAQSKADRLERYRTRAARYKSVTAAELQAAARKYLDPQRELRVSIVHSSLKP